MQLHPRRLKVTLARDSLREQCEKRGCCVEFLPAQAPSYLYFRGTWTASILAQWRKVGRDGGSELPVTVILSGRTARNIQH